MPKKLKTKPPARPKVYTFMAAYPVDPEIADFRPLAVDVSGRHENDPAFSIGDVLDGPDDVFQYSSVAWDCRTQPPTKEVLEIAAKFDANYRGRYKLVFLMPVRQLEIKTTVSVKGCV